MLGLAVTGLIAAFMAGVAANVTAFNTVVTYDLIQSYFAKDRDSSYYLRAGRFMTIGGILISVLTAFIAKGYSNIMNYIQTLFSIFNAPLFATFIIAMFWKRATRLGGVLEPGRRHGGRLGVSRRSRKQQISQSPRAAAAADGRHRRGGGRGGPDGEPVRHPPTDRRPVRALRPDPAGTGNLRLHAVKTKAAGININLWTGLGMLIFGGLMIFWALARPVEPDPPETRGEGSGRIRRAPAT